MKAYNGFKAEASSAAPFPMLPAGPYVGQIRAVKLDGAEPDQTLILRLEVSEGPEAGYFTKRYNHDKDAGGSFTPRYKGDLRLRVPNLENASDQYPQTTLKRFQDAIFRIESSNPGYHWDWNEYGLVGKTVGFSMREGTYNDVPYTTVARLETADDVRKGLVNPMQPSKPRYSEDYPAAQPAAAPASSPQFTVVETDELPF